MPGLVVVATWAGAAIGLTAYFLWLGEGPRVLGILAGSALCSFPAKWVGASIVRVAVVWLGCFAALLAFVVFAGGRMLDERPLASLFLAFVIASSVAAVVYFGARSEQRRRKSEQRRRGGLAEAIEPLVDRRRPETWSDRAV